MSYSWAFRSHERLHITKYMRFFIRVRTHNVICMYRYEIYHFYHDHSSPIEHVMCLANNINKANIIPWFSIKCKRVIRSVLDLEIRRYDWGVRRRIDDQGNHWKRSWISLCSWSSICKDFRSSYECLIKLEIRRDKRLMNWSYVSTSSSWEEENHEKSDSNSADFMTEKKSISDIEKVAKFIRRKHSVLRPQRRLNLILWFMEYGEDDFNNEVLAY